MELITSTEVSISSLIEPSCCTATSSNKVLKRFATVSLLDTRTLRADIIVGSSAIPLILSNISSKDTVIPVSASASKLSIREALL